jgi:hypothetical protein
MCMMSQIPNDGGSGRCLGVRSSNVPVWNRMAFRTSASFVLASKAGSNPPEKHPGVHIGSGSTRKKRDKTGQR